MSIARSESIYVAGHRGLVGSALVRHLQRCGFEKILTVTRTELDLRDPAAVDQWFAEYRPNYVIHAAGTVGGIQANIARPVEFLYDNLMMHATVLRAAHRHDAAKLLYLGSSCVYPRDCPQPIREDYLLSGELEPTNRPYALAKISGIELCQAFRRQYGASFISAMPTNLYGPGDKFDLDNSHILAALIRKFDDARKQGNMEVNVWGSGKPRRELLHVDDLARACLFLLENYDDQSPINIGTGQDLSVAEIADTVRCVVYPQAAIRYDTNRPDGTPRKLLDVARLHELGWRHEIDLEDGIRDTYDWYCKNCG